MSNVYTRSATEANVQEAVVMYLKYKGWVVRETSQHNRVTGGLVGLVDVEAWRHGVSVLAEIKRADGTLRPSQIKFRDEILPHCCATLWWFAWWSIDEAMEIEVLK